MDAERCESGSRKLTKSWTMRATSFPLEVAIIMNKQTNITIYIKFSKECLRCDHGDIMGIMVGGPPWLVALDSPVYRVRDPSTRKQAALSTMCSCLSVPFLWMTE
jgi:hypothetical protein